MGKSSKRAKESKRHKKSRHRSGSSKKRRKSKGEWQGGEAGVVSAAEALASALRAAKADEYRRVRRAVAALLDAGGGVDDRDAAGWSCLHHACNINSIAVARVLLNAGADAAALDPEGNSPAHFAARHGNVELLEELIYAERPADMDRPNLRGFTPREIALEVVEAQQLAEARSAAAARAAAQAARDAEWQRKLCDHAEDGDTAAGSWWGDDWSPGDPAAAGGSGIHEDDYATYVRKEMARRQEGRHYSTAARGGSRDDTKKARARKAAEAAANSRRILEEEMAKEKARRQPAVKTDAELHSDYERRWQTFLLADKPAGSVRYAAVPWVLPTGETSHTSVADVVLAPVGSGGDGDKKKRLRLELLRWHPDKFESRFGASLHEADRARILEAVTAVSAALTSISGR